MIQTKNGVLLRSIPISPNSDYMAGSDGLIYSRTKYKGFGKREYVDWYSLQGHKHPKGYSTVSLCHNNKKSTKNVHRLVCMAFHGMPKSASMQTRHLDGNPKNNKPENLRWGTQAENWQDREAHGRGMKGEKHHNAKFSNKEREHIRWCVKMGLCSQGHAARILGVAQGSISAIARSSH